MIIDKTALICLERILLHGYKAYFVGGCVRDGIMGIPAKDYDIATSATPTQISKIFDKTILTGEKYGTVTVLINKMAIEVTQFRTDGKYINNRKPEQVTFTDDIIEDLSRRDFTINAIAYNPSEGIIDPYNGIADIKSKVLRCVGHPDTRFTEDALRIMRLYRFSCTKGFCIDNGTEISAINNAALLQNISIERIYTELKKIIDGQYLINLLPLINSGALAFIGINNCTEPESLCKITKAENWLVKLYNLIALCGGDVELFITRCRLENIIEKQLESLIYAQTLEQDSDKLQIKQCLAKISPALLMDFLIVKNNLYGNYNYVIELLNEIIINNEPYLLNHLAVNGNDLAKLGLKGEEIGKCLEYLLNLVRLNPKKNEKQLLLSYIK